MARSRKLLDGEWEAHRTRRVVGTRVKKGRSSNNAQGPASRTRSSNKRRRLDGEVPSSSIQGGEQSRLEDHQTKIDTWSNVSSKQLLPEKRVLELILDILQRRDTHEIFAEPVDPDEVEDYYEIIKEPMDFGTMRAKLHEGLYKSLTQFENDVFLMTKNAMHFNASSTIYFRQARVVDELATEVFCVLRTSPESFESKFSESRRRNPRRISSQVEAGNSLNRTRRKSNGTMINDSLTSISMTPTNTFPSVRRRMAGCHRQGKSGPTCWGLNGDRDLICTEADERRYTYKPWISLLDEEESIVTLLSPHEKQLKHVMENDIGYSNSLMLFVKDLGPAIQAIAKQKLSGSFSFQDCQSRTFVDRYHGHEDKVARKRNDDATTSSVGLGNRSDGGEILLASSLLARAGDLSSTLIGFKNVGNNSTTIVDKSECLSEDYRAKDGSSMNSRPHFVSQMPHLKSWLGQTNAFGRLALLQRSLGSELNCFSNI